MAWLRALAHVVAVSTMALFLGCATTAKQADENASAGASRGKKERRCIRTTVTGSRLPTLVCEGDPPLHNIVEQKGEDFGNDVRRAPRPSGNR